MRIKVLDKKDIDKTLWKVSAECFVNDKKRIIEFYGVDHSIEFAEMHGAKIASTCMSNTVLMEWSISSLENKWWNNIVAKLFATGVIDAVNNNNKVLIDLMMKEKAYSTDYFVVLAKVLGENKKRVGLLECVPAMKKMFRKQWLKTLLIYSYSFGFGITGFLNPTQLLPLELLCCGLSSFAGTPITMTQALALFSLKKKIDKGVEESLEKGFGPFRTNLFFNLHNFIRSALHIKRIEAFLYHNNIGSIAVVTGLMHVYDILYLSKHKYLHNIMLKIAQILNNKTIVVKDELLNSGELC